VVKVLAARRAKDFKPAIDCKNSDIWRIRDSYNQVLFCRRSL